MNEWMPQDPEGYNLDIGKITIYSHETNGNNYVHNQVQQEHSCISSMSALKKSEEFAAFYSHRYFLKHSVGVTKAETEQETMTTELYSVLFTHLGIPHVCFKPASCEPKVTKIP